MNYLNISIAFLSDYRFVGSQELDRAAWLCLMRFCGVQENGGVIQDCHGWESRTWEQIAFVTRERVSRDSLLWRWEGTDLHVLGYNQDIEQQVQRKREYARKARKQQRADQHIDMVDSNQSTDQSERKVRKGKETEGKEMEGRGEIAAPSPSSSPDFDVANKAIADAGVPPTLAQALAVACTTADEPNGGPPEEFIAVLWHSAAARGWLDSKGVRIVNWTAHVRREWYYEKRRIDAQAAAAASVPAAGTGGAAPTPLWKQRQLAENELLEVQEQLRRLPSPNPDIFPQEHEAMMKRKTPLLARRDALRTRIDEVQRKEG